MTLEPRNQDGLSYKQYMLKVNIILAGICGLSSNDLADTDTYSAWQDCASPEDTARDILEQNDFPDDLLGDEEEDYDDYDLD